MRALITGGGGQLASDLQDLLGEAARSFTHAELDVTDSEAVTRALAQVKPDVVFNCAAYHNLDACEANPDQAWAANVRAVRDLAIRGPRLVHISTNYVFDGRRPEPYGEEDAPHPRSVYAITKLAGEYMALAYGSGALVVRTAGLYGLHGSASKGGNFVERMLRRARETERLTVVSDQFLQPTYTRDLAESLLEAVERGDSGLLHLTASGSCSWREFTQTIMEIAGVDVAVDPVRTDIAPGMIDRPANGVLARPRADALGLTPLPDWRQGLGRYMATAGHAVGR